MFRSFAVVIDRYRTFWFVSLVVVTIASAYAAFNIRYDFRPQALFEGNDDLVHYAEQFRETFGYEDAVLLIVAESVVAEQDALDAELLQWQAEVFRALYLKFKNSAKDESPRIRRVDAAALLRMPRKLLRRPDQIHYVIDSLNSRDAMQPNYQLMVTPEDEQRVRGVVGESKLLQGALVSADLKLSAMAVTVHEDVRKIELMREVMRNIDEILAEHPMPAGYRQHLSGLPAIRVDIVEHMQRDQRRLLPLVTILFIVVLTLTFWQPAGAVLPLTAVGVGLIATVGVLAVGGQSFNLVSNILPLLLLIIGVSNSVHVVSRFIQECQTYPDDRRKATRETMAHMAVACLLASLTTAIGFLSIAAARSEVLRDFGWQSALGMALLYVSTMLVLGVALPWFRPSQCGTALDDRRSPISHAVAISGYAVARHPWPTLLISLALLGGSLWVARTNTINSYLLETYDADNPTLQSLKLVEDRLAGVIPLEVSLATDDPANFLDPQTIRAIHDFQEYANQFDEVTLSRSYVDLLQEVYAKVRRKQTDRHKLPSLDGAGRRRAEMCDERLRRWSRVFDYHALMTQDGRRARILLRTRDVGTQRMLEVTQQFEQKLTELFPTDGEVRFRLTGDAYVSANAIDRFIRDTFYSLGAAALFIFIMIGLLFRSPRLGLVAALPNMTPLAITLGYMGLRGYEMNAANVIVFSISLGIAVDNTIHFMARFREEVRHTDDVALAVERTYEGTGKAIVLTTLLIISGLSVLLFSEFVPTRRVAELISVSMGAALVGDLLILPACLVLFWKRRSSHDISASSNSSA
jgi:hypothetical protein